MTYKVYKESSTQGRRLLSAQNIGILLGRSTTTPTGSQPAQTEENGKTLINFTMFQRELTQIQKAADIVPL